jgi:hypothetical protein
MNDCAGDVSRRTALHWACDTGSLGVVRQLLAHQGIQPNPRDIAGRTPLMVAVVKDHLEVVKEMVKDPRVDLDTKDCRGRSLEDVAKEAKVSIFKGKPKVQRILQKARKEREEERREQERLEAERQAEERREQERVEEARQERERRWQEEVDATWEPLVAPCSAAGPTSAASLRAAVVAGAPSAGRAATWQLLASHSAAPAPRHEGFPALARVRPVHNAEFSKEKRM